jgi:predicted O-methyltransferase YrrM
MAPGDLEGPYRRYVTTVSSPAYAISLPLASFLMRLADERRPGRLLDLGSGFSSYVFRRYAAAAGPGVEVYSVDDDASWLAKTRAYLTREGVATENLIEWERLADRGTGFDLVLHDLGTVASRFETVPRALELVTPGGLLVLDDLDVTPYRHRIAKLVEDEAVRAEDVTPETLDERGRYSWVLHRS